MFTDGSGGTDGPGNAAGPALRASSQAGWGVYVDARASSGGPRQGFEMCGPVDADLPTKNRNDLAEISAVARAVLYVRAHLVRLGETFVLEEDGVRVTPPFRRIRVYTDSEFAERATTAEYCVHSPGCREVWLQLLEDLDVLEQ